MPQSERLEKNANPKKHQKKCELESLLAQRPEVQFANFFLHLKKLDKKKQIIKKESRPAG